MAFDYEAAKAEFGVARAREMEKAANPATDAPQATSQPAVSGTQKAGKGGAGWNEDFDEAWGKRVLENPKLKETFGLSDYGSLRDPETRRQINRWLRQNRESGGGGGGQAAAVPAAAKPAAAPAAVPKGPVQPGSTTGRAGGSSDFGNPPPPPAAFANLKPSILPTGRLPVGLLYQSTILPAASGEIPAMNGPWWPSYPAGGSMPQAATPGTASMQAAALKEQKA